MKTTGIIAEYNPFHNGHLYQMREARSRSGADYVIAVMSPDFVQRGEPALLDKWVRARMALEAGADLVLELPVRSASGSAEFFALGAVSMLASLGVVDALSFGYEKPGLSGAGRPFPDMGKAADILTDAARFFSEEEPAQYAEELKRLLSEGRTFARARMDAYLKYTGSEDPAGLLSSPNNILAVEYLKALMRENSTISAVPVPRVGAGYHDTALPGTLPAGSGDEIPRTDAGACEAGSAGAGRDRLRFRAFASASGIRSAVSEGRDVSACMPPSAYALMSEELSQNRFAVPSDLNLLLHDALLRNEDRLQEYLDVSGDLANRIRAMLGTYTGFEAFAAQLKTRQMTLTRIRRALLHILLEIRPGTSRASYARVLGFRRSAQPLLHAISERASVPLITKLPSEDTLPDGLREDLKATRIWEMIVCAKTGRPVRSEYQRKLIIL